MNKLTIEEQSNLLHKGEITPTQLVQEYKKAYQAQSDVNAYIEFFDDAEEQAKQLEAAGIQKSPLWGIPGAIKDNISIKGHKLTCASRILENYVSPYNAEVITRLHQAGFVNLGRLNHDEFAIGASGHYTVFGPTLNPLDKTRLVGGSSSGSAAAVAAGLTSFALGTDTGGSCRLPASYCGIFGFKPTYGAIPRHGVVEYAPSLDTVGILARSPKDIATVFNSIAGRSPYDESSCDIETEYPDVAEGPVQLKGLKIAIFSTLLERCHPAVLQACEKACDFFRQAGAELIDAKMDIEEVLLNVYYITACSEAASSLSRFDGARYGLKVPQEGKTIDELYAKTRSAGFGHEVQRRILLGNYFLSEQNYQRWYAKALSLRRHLQSRSQELARQGCSIYLLPGFNQAPKIGVSEEDTYASDLAGVFANLMGVPSLVLPLMRSADNLPVSFQLAGAKGSDRRVLEIGQQLYKELK